MGSAGAAASAVGDAEGAAALGAVAAGLGALLTVACWRDRAVAAAHPRAGTITRMARKGQTFFHLDGLGRFAGAVKFIPGVLRTHAFRLSENREWGAGGARGMWRGLYGIRLVL